MGVGGATGDPLDCALALGHLALDNEPSTVFFVNKSLSEYRWHISDISHICSKQILDI